MVIVLSAPTLLADEGQTISRLLEAGVYRLHLRKPGATTAQLAAIMGSIPAQHHPNIVVHGHPELAQQFNLCGIHGTNLPHAHSCSLHALSELATAQQYRYVFLSPIFPSISKQGHLPPFSLEECAAAVRRTQGTVVALGGISPHTAPIARAAGFAGIAVLGAVWSAPEPVAAFRLLCSAWEDG
jgi:thiamine-phosphate pyrophosphorylase